MSITKITDPLAVPITIADYTAQNELIQSALTGLFKVTLSEYDTDLAPAVKVGSVFNVGGTTYIVSTADETPTGYSGITVSTTFYLYFDSSAGVFIYSATTPVWNDVYQGWYDGTDRALFSMYKDSGGTLYKGKVLLQELGHIYTKSLKIGSWDMDTVTSVTIPHGISDSSNIRTIQTIIYPDADVANLVSDVSLISSNVGTDVEGAQFIDASDRTKIQLYRFTGGMFDSTNHDDITINRGWLTIQYVL